mmetsp:Transcript_15642/g.27278  ORF Transcript_15642/g.27278 Transcript_15642/m.27278 type:complete len:118 (-) Transcript_15642:1121-1474(-)
MTNCEFLGTGCTKSTMLSEPNRSTSGVFSTCLTPRVANAVSWNAWKSPPKPRRCKISCVLLAEQGADSICRFKFGVNLGASKGFGSRFRTVFLQSRRRPKCAARHWEKSLNTIQRGL